VFGHYQRHQSRHLLCCLLHCRGHPQYHKRLQYLRHRRSPHTLLYHVKGIWKRSTTFLHASNPDAIQEWSLTQPIKTSGVRYFSALYDMVFKLRMLEVAAKHVLLDYQSEVRSAKPHPD
jgi:hypothetical protein